MQNEHLNVLIVANERIHSCKVVLEKDKQPQSYVTDGSQQAGVYWPHVCYKFSYIYIYKTYYIGQRGI